MAKIEPANLLLKDKDGNSAIIKSLTDNDLNKLRVGLSDVSDLKTRVKAVEDNGYVSYNSVQTLNEEQCSQAQANMDVPGLSANNTFTGNMTVEANVKADSMTLNTSSDYAKLSASTNDHGIKLLGGSSDTTGASIDLRGSTDTGAPNTFTVSASNDVALVGSKTGSLTWSSENVVRKVNNLPADASGNVLLGTEKSTFNKVVFDTGYFSISTNATYKFDLTGSDLENVSKENVNVRLVAKVTTAHNSFEVGDIAQLTTSFDSKADNDVLGVCSYIQGNTFYLRSSANTALSINSGTGWMRKSNVQIKAVLTAFIPDDGSILLIAEDQTNTSKLIGLPDGTLTWKDKNLVRSVNGVNADTSGNVQLDNLGGGGLEVGDIALAPLGIDETDNCRRYLNGQVILQSQFSKFTEKLKHAITLYPNLVTTEQNWQSAVTLSPLGQCGKFVIDDEAGTIRLPKVVNVMGALDLSTIGQTVEAGLPNITGKIDASNTSPLIQCFGETTQSDTVESGALSGIYKNQSQVADAGTSVSMLAGFTFDASNSNSIYGNSTTIQQEAIKYPYFIQVAISNSEDVQIDTQVRLNNPFSLFMPYWSPIELNNLSWLRSNKQWNNGSVYVSAYEFLLEKYNAGTEQTETIADVSVTYKLADNGMKIITDKSVYDELISASGSAWFFVLDTENTQFVLPYTNGFAQFGNELGKFTEAGLPNITGSMTPSYLRSNEIPTISGAFIGSTAAEASSWGGTVQPSVNDIKIDASKSNPIYGNSDTVQPNSVTGYLYFYVGEVEQDANIIAASGLAESISRKADNDLGNVPNSKGILVESYHNGASWYRVYSDGFCEQGGIISSTNSIELDITFIKPFINTEYYFNYVVGSQAFLGGSSYNVNYLHGFANKTTTGIRVEEFNNFSNSTETTWEAKGYIS